MSAINLEKFDRFAILAVFMIMILAVLIIFTVNTLFRAFFTSQTVKEPENAQAEFFQEQSLDNAHKVFEEKKNIQLDLKL